MATNPDQFGAATKWNPGYGPTGATTAVAPTAPMSATPAPAPVAPVSPNPDPMLQGVTPPATSAPTGGVDPNLKTAFEAAKASGVAAPQESGAAASAVSAFTNTAASTPSFYKPQAGDPGFNAAAPKTVYDSKGKGLSFEEYKKMGGKGIMGGGGWEDVKNGPVPIPKQSTPLQGIDQQLAADPGYQNLLKDYAEFNSIVEKTKSLTDTYNEVVKSSGLEAINTDLINAKNIIEGTEDDIRNEVRASQGFATDSQVMALSQARNKTLIKSYNKLVDQKVAIQDQVNTMVNLAGQDRQFAMQSIQQKLQIDEQINSYRDKFINNAKEGYQNYINAVGYSGLYNSLINDPNSMAIVERTMGLPPGTIAEAAFREDQEQAQAQAQQDFENSIDMTKLGFEEQRVGFERQRVGLEGARLGLEKQRVALDAAKFKAEQDKELASIISTPQVLAQQKNTIQQTDTLLNDKALNSAVGSNYLGRFSVVNQLSGAKSNFIAGISQLTNQLTVETLQNAKKNGATFGALSQGELDLLAASATKINSWAIKKDGNVTGYNTSEKNFRAELDKINNFGKLDYILKGGKPTEVGVEIHPDGYLYSKNSDGSYNRYDELGKITSGPAY